MADSKEREPDENPDLSPPPPVTPPVTPPKAEKTGWIEGYMKQSMGLPDDVAKTRPEEGKTLWSYAGLGLQFAGATALFAVMGYAIDRRFGTTPWGLVSLSMVGVIGGMYLLIKESLKDNTTAPRPPKSPGIGKKK